MEVALNILVGKEGRSADIACLVEQNRLGDREGGIVSKLRHDLKLPLDFMGPAKELPGRFLPQNELAVEQVSRVGLPVRKLRDGGGLKVYIYVFGCEG